MRCGFKIGGGIDQDYHKSPQGYTDNVSLTCVYHLVVHMCPLFPPSFQDCFNNSYTDTLN